MHPPRIPTDPGPSRAAPWVVMIVLVLLTFYIAVTAPSAHSSSTVTLAATNTPAPPPLQASTSKPIPTTEHPKTGAYDPQPFKEKIVHFDLKGAPPRVSYLKYIFSLIKKWGASGVLMEYEDMFSYSGELSVLQAREPYTLAEIQELNKAAKDLGLELIPLVQTFGHMEFVLKHNKYRNLSENFFETNTICPSDNASIVLIREMLTQIRQLHPDAKRIHIGADETYHIGEDPRCTFRLTSDRDLSFRLERLKLDHISKVARTAKSLNFTEVLAWNDMFAITDVDELRRYNFHELIVPVVWGYAIDVTNFGYFPLGLFDRLKQVFGKVYFASAYKGANGKEQTFIDVDRYLSNHLSYVGLFRQNEKNLEGKMSGLVLTGWSRFWHGAPLCELLPVGLPSLAINMAYVENVYATAGARTAKARRWLNCPHLTRPSPRLKPRPVRNETFIPPRESIFADCVFEGVDVYEIVEHLRFVHWMVNRFERQPAEHPHIRQELDTIELKVRDVFPKYFYKDTIMEWLLKNVDSQRFRLRAAARGQH